MNQFLLTTPVGTLQIKASENALLSIEFSDHPDGDSLSDVSSKIIQQTVSQLEAYFEGNRKTFDLNLSPTGTDFQQRVWRALLEIPYGQTTTYAELSARLEDPKAVRAVGTANGKNPIPIIIPCHRVIGANNNLTGYAGGIERKRWLLQHEGAILL